MALHPERSRSTAKTCVEFIEFFIRGAQGTITVDLGTLDEDRVRRDDEGIPVGVGLLDTEETNPDTRDNALDVGEDTGIDAVSGNDAIEVPGDDGNDDFTQSNGADNFPANPNGTENNNTLDTEDDNFNGLLDRARTRALDGRSIGSALRGPRKPQPLTDSARSDCRW